MKMMERWAKRVLKRKEDPSSKDAF